MTERKFLTGIKIGGLDINFWYCFSFSIIRISFFNNGVMYYPVCTRDFELLSFTYSKDRKGLHIGLLFFLFVYTQKSLVIFVPFKKQPVVFGKLILRKE